MAKRSLRPGDIVRIALGDNAENGVLLGAVPNVPRGQQIVRLADKCQSLTDPSQFDELTEAATSVAKLFIVGWENVVDPFSQPDANGKKTPLPFTPENIAIPLNLSDLMEIVQVAVETFTTTADDKKKSESPLSSDAANSANPASADAAK
jgi:hypothetical protein